MLDFILTNNKGMAVNVKIKGSLVCSDHEMVQFGILNAARMEHSKLTTPDYGRADCPLQGSDWYTTMGQSPGEKMHPRKLVNIQGSPPPISGVMHPNKKEVRQKCHG